MIPDEVNNAIVVRANAVDYGKVKKTIETLDIVPRAVLIEVMVAEVDLTKDFVTGCNTIFRHIQIAAPDTAYLSEGCQMPRLPTPSVHQPRESATSSAQSIGTVASSDGNGLGMAGSRIHRT